MLYSDYKDDKLTREEYVKRSKAMVEQIDEIFTGVLKVVYDDDYANGALWIKVRKLKIHIVLQLAIQYVIINNRKDGAYYGNKKCKCNSSCAARN